MVSSDSQHGTQPERNSTEKKLARLLVVSLGKSIIEIPPFFRDH